MRPPFCLTSLAMFVLVLGSLLGCEANLRPRSRGAVPVESIEGLDGFEVGPFDAPSVLLPPAVMGDDLTQEEAVAAALASVFAQLDEKGKARFRARAGFAEKDEPDVPALLGRFRERTRTLCSADLAFASFFSKVPKRGACKTVWRRRDEVTFVSHVEVPRSPELLRAVAFARAFSLGWPVSRRAPLRSPFGPRIHPVLLTERLHRGIDLSVPDGTEVRAPGPSVVRRVREDAVNGRWLELDHGAGVRTTYCHASLVTVGKGDKIQKGDVVALSGRTGRVTGPHLHYQLSVGGEPKDPLAFRMLRVPDETWAALFAEEERGRPLPFARR